RAARYSTNLLSVQANLRHAIYIVFQPIGRALEDGAHHVAASMRQAQTEEDSACIGVPGGGHGSTQAGEKDQAAGGGWGLRGFAIQEVVGADTAPLSPGAFVRCERVQEPAITAA